MVRERCPSQGNEKQYGVNKGIAETVLDHYYPVIPVNMPLRAMESRGTRRKFWVLGKDNRHEWLLKFPRPGTGEHWAEKIAAEIGKLIKVNTARVELATAGDELATICQSFSSGEDGAWLDNGSATLWIHGSEFLDLANPDYDVHLVWDNRAHNIKRIIAATEKVAGVGSMNPMPRWDNMMEDMASYALLDGLIGNTDRHHDNWMIAYVADAGDIRMYLAPSFDHASSLGRELSDERRERVLSTNDVLDYLRKGRGGVFVDGNRRRAPSPLRLAQLLCRWRPKLARRWYQQLGGISDTDFRSVIYRIPSEFMSDLAKDLAYQIVTTSKNELLRSFR